MCRYGPPPLRPRFATALVRSFSDESTTPLLSRIACLLCTAALLLAPVALAGEAGPAAADRYDLMVVGGTPGGVAMAVRAAREGLSVLLVNRSPVLGGQHTNGIGVWDTLYDGYRSPLYQEVRQALFDIYRHTFSEGSVQWKAAQPGPKTERFVNGRFEPSMAEKVIDALVAKETRLTVLRGWDAVTVDRAGPLVRSATIANVAGGQTRTITAHTFADCTYEGDFAALAKAEYRMGREPRTQHDEPHAGRVYTTRIETKDPMTGFPVESADGRLNLRYYHITHDTPPWPESTGEGDRAVMASNFRLVLCTDPANRVLIDKPANYDAAAMAKQIPGTRIEMPNRKFSWNRPEPLPFKDRWAEADWAERDRMKAELLNLTLQKLWFLQHDPSVPATEQAFWKECGLPRDEFVANGHVPWEIYIREARRIMGRTVLTQHDFMMAPGLGRAPIHADSIAFTDWVIDVHAVHPDKVRGSAGEGALILSRETRPGQVPYSTMIPKGIDNLLVPVALSSTHVAWGAIRLEPVWMQTGEAAAYATAMAIRAKSTPASIDVDALLRTLVANRSMVTFLNDGDVASNDAWVPAAQYFGTKGFFHDYNVRANDPLTRDTAKVWIDAFHKLKHPNFDPNAVARAVAHSESNAGDRVAAEPAALAALLPGVDPPASMAPFCTRGEALAWLFAQLP